jgi:hypothetical protein
MNKMSYALVDLLCYKICLPLKVLVYEVLQVLVYEALRKRP